jgi:chromate transport protein ChrA
VLGYFLGLGTWGFGGPIATVAYIQRDVSDRTRGQYRLLAAMAVHTLGGITLPVGT